MNSLPAPFFVPLLLLKLSKNEESITLYNKMTYGFSMHAPKRSKLPSGRIRTHTQIDKSIYGQGKYEAFDGCAAGGGNSKNSTFNSSIKASPDEVWSPNKDPVNPRNLPLMITIGNKPAIAKQHALTRQ